MRTLRWTNLESMLSLPNAEAQHEKGSSVWCNRIPARVHIAQQSPMQYKYIVVWIPLVSLLVKE